MSQPRLLHLDTWGDGRTSGLAQPGPQSQALFALEALAVGQLAFLATEAVMQGYADGFIASVTNSQRNTVRSMHRGGGTIVLIT